QRGRAVGEVGAMLGAALGVAAQVHRVIYVDAHLAPDFWAGAGVAVALVRLDLRAVVLECADIVDIGRADDLAAPIAVQVGHTNVRVVGPPAVAGLAFGQARPARAGRAIGLEHGPLVVAAAAGPRGDDLQPAVAVQVIYRQ